MYEPFFDQQEPEVPVLGLIASLDRSEPYELEAVAVFKIQRGFLVVDVWGCSCWPDRGGTEQTICNQKVDVDRKLRGKWLELLDKCQAVNWKIQKVEKTK